MQIYNEKKHTEQWKIQNAQFEEKGNTRKCNDIANSSAQEDKKFKENPDYQ